MAKKYKVLVLRNRLPFEIETDCQRVKEYFATRLPFQVEFTFKDVNVPVDKKVYDYRQGYNSQTGKLTNDIAYLGLADFVKDNCRNLVNKDEYDCVVFAWNRDEMQYNGFEAMTSWTHWSPLYKGTQFIQLALNAYIKNQGRIYRDLSHEMMHQFCFALHEKGAKVLDEMDLTILPDGNHKPYYLNDFPEDPKSNYGNTLENIKPYLYLLGSDIMPVVEIKRTSDDGFQALGTLTTPGFTCLTLERPWKNNKPFLSCIPTGTYNVTWNFSMRFLKNTYEVKNVLNRTGIRWHGANYVSQLNGCIALGNNLLDINKDSKLDILNSRATLKAFEDFMGRKPFILKVT